jgi:prepilin peptidase CpaA
VFGKIDSAQTIILFTSLVAVITDLRSGKIYNWLTLPVFAMGIIISSFAHGWIGFGESLLAAVAALALYGWMFGLRILGGGDVKLLMALGACGGLKYTVQVAILGVLLGGLMSLGILVYKNRLKGFLKRLYGFLFSVFVPELEVLPLKVDQNLTMPFGIPIAVAAVWVIFGNPFVCLGIELWS